MPPRLPSLVAYLRPIPPLPQTHFLTAFLVPFFQARHASVSILSSLSDTPGAYNKRIRRGRGPSSGKGKTSGRGHKGQKQHGKVPAKFQGGQTPIEVVKGQRGFTNNWSVEMSPINLDRIQSWIDQGRLDPTQPITLKELADSRCLHGVKDGVKLLAKGKEQLKSNINILVSRASAAAIEAVEAAGGKVTTRYYTEQSIRRVLRSQSVSSFTPLGVDSPDNEAPNLQKTKPFMYRLPDPTGRKDLEYYRDKAHRGYLSHLVEEGQGPSLYFKAPNTSGKKKKTERQSGASKTSNMVW